MAQSDAHAARLEAEISSRSPKRRLTPKGEATRARLIEIAAAAFATDGYAGTSIRDLAERSGVSSGAIYSKFSSKADLLAAAVDAAIASDMEALPTSVTRQTLPAIDAYQFEHLSQRDRVRALLLEAAVAARTDPDVRAQLRDAIEPRIDLATVAHMEWRDRAGVDVALDMQALVMFLWSADLGFGVLEALGVDLPEAGAWSDLMSRLLTSLEEPGAHPGAPTPRPTPPARPIRRRR